MSDEAVQQFRECVKNIDIAVAKHKKRSKAEKHSAYKKKRVGEAKVLWDELQEHIQVLEKQYEGQVPDACYISEKTRITLVCQAYIDDLNNIVEVGENEANDEMKKFVQRQNTRLENLENLLEDVENQVNDGGVLTNAFCKLKIKGIEECWNRILVSYEECEIDRDTLPDNLRVRTDENADNMKGILLTLYEQMESPSEGQSKGPTGGLKVPRVTLPKFEGDYYKWISFRDLFTAIVIKNKCLTDAERMQMLKTNLSGEAENLIRDLTIADINFDCAWRRLIDRYDNNRVVVQKYLQNLINQAPGKHDAKSVKKLLDITDQTLLALGNMGRPVKTWDDWIVIILTQKLSEECRKDWERSVGDSQELPTWDQLKKFLENQYRMLERLDGGKKRVENKPGDTTKKVVSSYQSTVSENKCAVCNEKHHLFKCDKWKKLNVKERWEVAKKKRLCFSCLKSHPAKQKCDKQKPCKKCEKQHSTWLHQDKESPDSTKQLAVLHGAFNQKDSKEVLLATAVVLVADAYGHQVKLRALIDSGSQGSLITARSATRLQHQQVQGDTVVQGLGSKLTGTGKCITVTLKSRFNDTKSYEVQCYILKQLTKWLPDNDLDIGAWRHIKGLKWADPTFHKSGQIDVLLGMDVIVEIMKPGLVRGVNGQPMAQNTQLGWIISGNIHSHETDRSVHMLHATTENTPDDWNKFWEIEDLHPKRILTRDEQECEDMYKSTVKRDDNGRYVVKIPFKESMIQKLGTSKSQAVSRFFSLERRFASNPALYDEYATVMDEYLQLGHMVEVTEKPQVDKKYYIPHHAVIKPDSLTTKTRVVFDASARTTTGISLNDCMHVGGKQQTDLFDIMIKWRMHKVVFKSDVEKMYRQVQLDKDDQRFHTIVWRRNPKEQLKEYQLTTATFGTAAAPFLATRTLNQIAQDNAAEYPLARAVIQEDFYVDDLISGGNNVDQVKELITEIREALNNGKMSLRKWTSNSQEILDSLPAQLTEKSLQSFMEDEYTKALGLKWNPRTDNFCFKVSWSSEPTTLTKRQLLSEASRLFDPLGWLTPVIITAKIMMQMVWLANIGWDDEVPDSIKEKWEHFKGQLLELEKITISRWLHTSSLNTSTAVSIHCFSDASETAYAAVVYIRAEEDEEVVVSLIAAKTRVAPVKTKVTLPRLELCGAVLGAQLSKRIQDTLQFGHSTLHVWSDSMITLGWIQADPRRFKTFVSNRIVEANSWGVDRWLYVKSEENPADCASRGIMPDELEGNTLWWHGPEWLRQPKSSWNTILVAEPELERKSVLVNIVEVQFNDTLNRFS